ncbi:MAG TPA: co-chaperone GroES [Brumimicrobium sp.]|nr:co-chaperone GroES [Brumimicrobium sp.]
MTKVPALSIGIELVDSLSSEKLIQIKNKQSIMSALKPLADRVLIKPIPAEEKTASGIIIPDAAKEKPLKGTVVAVGNGKKDEPMTVKEGDTVLYGQYSGTEIKIDGDNYLIMKEADIYGVFQ